MGELRLQGVTAISENEWALVVAGSPDDIKAIAADYTGGPVLVIRDATASGQPSGSLPALGSRPTDEARRLAARIGAHYRLLGKVDPREGGVADRMGIAIDRFVKDAVNAELVERGLLP